MPKFDHTGRDKEIYVESLFASVASKYDFLNSVMSLGQHNAWRRYAIKRAGLKSGDRALDVAAGTADFTCELLKVVGPNGLVVGADFCLPMLRLGASKIGKVTDGIPALAVANAETLPFPDDYFDCATIGFALRNVADVKSTLLEMTRVVKPGGWVVSLEIVGPDSGIIVPFWRLYFNRLMPAVTRFLGGRKEAYQYLPASVERFCTRLELKRIMEGCGLSDVSIRGFALGAVCLHMGKKI